MFQTLDGRLIEVTTMGELSLGRPKGGRSRLMCSSRKYPYPPPLHGGQRKFRGDGGFKGGKFPRRCGVACRVFFRGPRVRLISKLSIILPLIGVSKQKLLFSSMIFYLWLAECFFTACTIVLICNTIVVGSRINFRLSTRCFVTQ